METPKTQSPSGGGDTPPCTGLTTDVLPEVQSHGSAENSDTGVSTRNALTATENWYALRTTYGREKRAYDYITAHGGTAFLPTVVKEKEINGKKKLVEVSRIPNIFFAYGTEEAVKAFVYDNHNLPFLRFYYKHTHIGVHIKKTPMIVPDSQIRSLQIICDSSPSRDVLVVPNEVTKFRKGEKVRVTEGNFKGVEGIVARYLGQQRVGIVIDGLLTAVTAYIPSSFLVKDNN